MWSVQGSHTFSISCYSFCGLFITHTRTKHPRKKSHRIANYARPLRTTKKNPALLHTRTRSTPDKKRHACRRSCPRIPGQHKHTHKRTQTHTRSSRTHDTVVLRGGRRSLHVRECRAQNPLCSVVFIILTRQQQQITLALDLVEHMLVEKLRSAFAVRVFL